MISLLSSVLVYSLVVTSTPVKRCEHMSYDDAVKIAKEAIIQNSSREFTDFTGDKEKKLLAIINSVPPVSQWTADHILVFENTEDPPIIALSEKGCLTKMFKMPKSEWLRVRQAAIGDPS